jgi:hypothetical protein
VRQHLDAKCFVDPALVREKRNSWSDELGVTNLHLVTIFRLNQVFSGSDGPPGMANAVKSIDRVRLMFKTV